MQSSVIADVLQSLAHIEVKLVVARDERHTFGNGVGDDDVCVIIGNFGWADLGSWQSYYDLAPKDTDDNAAGRNHLISYNSKGNLVALPEGQLAVIEDLGGYAVIEAGNVLVVCPLEKTPTVLRKYVNDVKIKMGEDFV